MACLCTPTAFFPFATPAPTPGAPTSVPTKTSISPCQNGNCQDACSDLMLDIINASDGSGSPLKTFTGNTDSNGEYRQLASYRVVGNDLVGASYLSSPPDLEQYKTDTDTHHAIWNLFINIIPSDSRQMLNEFIIFTDGSMEILAAVEQKDAEQDIWSLEVDIIDAKDDLALTATLLHEFAHLMTLNNTQMTLYDEQCEYEYANPGCGTSGSYIDDFFNQFWRDIYDEWSGINDIEDEESRYQELAIFHQKYQSQFLTEYSATDTAEDIAESWMYFILVPMPDGDTIAEKKILFFYQYPELVHLRTEITSSMCSYFLYTVSP